MKSAERNLEKRLRKIETSVHVLESAEKKRAGDKAQTPGSAVVIALKTADPVAKDRGFLMKASQPRK